ncbi:transmembrane protein rich in alanine, arginine and proline [Mycolicibacterium conceptionense]|uniref:Transmembrane protein rich in alanine, arginine and proline n=1 Tax=Mycolicibacterium conceptionense TaxID=451644 RepID=A0A0U1DXL4_9MYCO|nr:transmembrane protein rich in alanine, arginine and proline [Mycolicibacterium conceptionense]
MSCDGYSRRMTVLPRGGRPRRGGRRPGWLLLTVLLVLAILASSALVFTDRVELLKLAVILALWAAVVAAFVSVIYRRQSDLDQAKARDLKFVYDLQLDREISARREYELTVETQLRRELASELRAQAADEVAALRSELAALRANLEILFDTDLVHRPAIETDKSAPRTAGRVTASRLDVPPVEVTDIRSSRTEESPIIDVPAEPHPPENDWATSGGAHRLPSRPVPAGEQPRRRRRQQDPQPIRAVRQPPRRLRPWPPNPPNRPSRPGARHGTAAMPSPSRRTVITPTGSR